MKLLKVCDANNYDPTWIINIREAVRAVIIKNNKIALVKSEKEGFYKFPGGGIEKGESHTETIIRETLEETGLRILPETIKELGMIKEKRRSIYDNSIFEQNSYYYFADVESDIRNQNLDEYEKELGFILEWIDVKIAYNKNVVLGNKSENGFLLREAYILNYLIENTYRNK